MEITGISDDVSDENLEGKVIEVLNEIQVDVSTSDTEACHRIGKSKNSSKKTIVRFINRKYAKKALLNRKSLRNNVTYNNIYINENLTKANNTIVYNCRKLKCNSMIDKNYSREGVIHISSPTIRNGKVFKVLHMNTLFDMFPEYNFNTEEKMIKSIMILCNLVIELPFLLFKYTYIFVAFSIVFLLDVVIDYYRNFGRS